MTDMDKEEKPGEVKGNDDDQKSDQQSQGPRNETTSPERGPENLPLEQWSEDQVHVHIAKHFGKTVADAFKGEKGSFRNLNLHDLWELHSLMSHNIK